jgi:hypothetical protein
MLSFIIDVSNKERRIFLVCYLGWLRVEPESPLQKSYLKLTQTRFPLIVRSPLLEPRYSKLESGR